MSLRDEDGQRTPQDPYFSPYPMLSLRPENLEVSRSSDTEKVIALCGKDPATATHQEMDETDPRLAHDRVPNHGPICTTWRRAVGRSS